MSIPMFPKRVVQLISSVWARNPLTQTGPFGLAAAAAMAMAVASLSLFPMCSGDQLLAHLNLPVEHESFERLDSIRISSSSIAVTDDGVVPGKRCIADASAYVLVVR
ncbi:hypothetical protein F5148DRAFT_1294869 [Russula earlei]|uniref:Uncharacterized protein n=1 Tax=Russula earlei TaxID=71964 RepID=A0ACC0TR76_9AGAM|nr:hypothetical protein F5148DRAFT_1294869 [Russula earlei]